MTDTTSPVIDFYPTNFQQDPNGKRFAWLWVVLLPFIDEKRLMKAFNSVAVRVGSSVWQGMHLLMKCSAGHFHKGRAAKESLWR